MFGIHQVEEGAWGLDWGLRQGLRTGTWGRGTCMGAGVETRWGKGGAVFSRGSRLPPTPARASHYVLGNLAALPPA